MVLALAMAPAGYALADGDAPATEAAKTTPDAATGEAAAGCADKEGAARSFCEGGPYMWPILFIGVIALIIVFERAFVLYFRTTTRRVHFLTQMRKLVLSGNFDKAIQFANSEPGPLARIVKAGLLQVRQADEVVQSAMDEAALAEIPLIEQRTGFLPMLSNVATLAGLLGTIVGLIQSFGAVAEADAATKATVLADGISEAMNCTAFGLLVAIPALLSYALLQSRTQRCVDDINAASVNIVNLVLINRDRLGLTTPDKGSAAPAARA
jgi:biopolymer transport protein ExbB/TolQ